MSLSSPAVLAGSPPLNVWDHSSHAQFQPGLLPRLTTQFLFTYLAIVSHLYPQVVGLKGASILKPHCVTESEPLPQPFSQKVKNSTACWVPESKRN